MQTLSSAACSHAAPRSASEHTAIARQARMTLSAISPRLAIRTERKAIARRSVCEFDERHDLAAAFFDDVAHNGGDPDRARRIAVHQHALRIELDALARLRREGAIVQELADARLHFFQVANDRARQASIDEAAFV